MRDLHLHTLISCDSDETMEAYLPEAAAKGLKTLCFTDHVDLNKNDYGYGIYDADRYFQNLTDARRTAKGKIELLSGFEFGETHLYPGELSHLLKKPYDFVIGSIHWVRDLFPDPGVRARISAKEFFHMYWQEMLLMVRAGGFDSLAHIDFPKRYYGELYIDQKMLDEILKCLIDSEIALEINTSSLRKGLSEAMPGREILEKYVSLGGKYVTVGSDSHMAQDIGSDFDFARRMIDEFRLQEVVFRERKMEIA